MRWERQDLRNIRKVYTCTDIIYILMSVLLDHTICLGADPMCIEK
jgi:hypothetical protein